MNVFKRIAINVRESVVRFPVSLLLGIVCSVIASILVIGNVKDSVEKILISYLKAGSWGIVFSVFVQLLLERLVALKKLPHAAVLYAVSQAVALVFCIVPMRILFNSESVFTWICYFGTLFALILGVFFLLKFIQGENLLAYTISYSFSIASIASCCIGCGCSIITLAIEKLILKEKSFNEEIYMVIWICSFFIFAIQFFIAYFSRKDEFVIPKAVTVINFYILFPLYAILLFVLYVYIVQSLVLRTMPHMNWFVSIATALFIAFWFAFKPFENKITKFLYKAGAYFLMPLVLIQWINFIQRINAYGFTTARVASLYYIIFSTAFLILCAIKCGKYNFHAIWVLAVIFLVASVTPLNIKRMALKSQMSRIEKIFKAHNLFKDGKVVPASNETEFSDEEKEQILESFSSFDLYAKDIKIERIVNILSYEGFDKDNWNGFELFKHNFGFERKESYLEKNSRYISFNANKKYVYDISAYKKMSEFEELKKNGKIFAKTEFGDVDITDFIAEQIKSNSLNDRKEPLLYVSPDGIELYFNCIHFYLYDNETLPDMDSYLNCAGYAFLK